jgi:hypothetical protein
MRCMMLLVYARPTVDERRGPCSVLHYSLIVTFPDGKPSPRFWLSNNAIQGRPVSEVVDEPVYDFAEAIPSSLKRRKWFTEYSDGMKVYGAADRLATSCVVVTVAEEGNISRAVRKRLFIAPGSLARDIRNLEKRKGYPVIVRRRDGVAMTPGGTVFVEEARKSLSHFATSRSGRCRESRRDGSPKYWT